MNIRILLILFTIAIAMPASAGNGGDDVKNIQGTWTIASAEIGGSPFPPLAAKIITLKLDDGKYVVNAENADKGTYTIDPTAKPKALDIIGTEGPNAGKRFPCIYELSGDTLKVCYQLGEGPRPAEFKSPAGTQIFLVTYQRKVK
ncbi:MAG TPA: TIGR03067 domain-containing protein [Candidatus Acidoferrales bacterium]|jgi:uncharacterized protein (TIGR03067 family)|nr:TIGR03067 domain-containing protein [Candidatus Acidoferrales bacterium]